MLDPGTQSIVTAIASPAVLAAVIGYFLNRYLEKQDQMIQKFIEEVGALKTAKAVNDVLVDLTRRELKELIEEHVRTRSSIEAAWRVIDQKRESA